MGVAVDVVGTAAEDEEGGVFCRLCFHGVIFWFVAAKIGQRYARRKHRLQKFC